MFNKEEKSLRMMHSFMEVQLIKQSREITVGGGRKGLMGKLAMRAQAHCIQSQR